MALPLRYRQKKYSYTVTDELLGQGQSGSVYKAIQNETGRTVAIKIVDLDDISSTEEDHLDNEVKILEFLSKSGCQQYILCFIEAFVIEDRAYIVTEYLEGNTLQEYFGELTPQQVYDVAMYIAYGIKTLHDLNIAHLDIKPYNILLNPETMKLDIIDFGLSCRGIDCKYHPNLLGSPKYIAPEAYDRMSDRNIEARKKRDVYAYGLILYQLVVGGIVVMKSYPDNPSKMIPPTLDPDELEPFFRVISNCLMSDPNQRATIDQVIELLKASRI